MRDGDGIAAGDYDSIGSLGVSRIREIGCGLGAHTPNYIVRYVELPRSFLDFRFSEISPRPPADKV